MSHVFGDSGADTGSTLDDCRLALLSGKLSKNMMFIFYEMKISGKRLGLGQIIVKKKVFIDWMG